MTLRIPVKLFAFGLMVLGLVHAAFSITTAAMESTDAANGCANSNWITITRSCYLHVREGFNFYQANKSCMTLGANLVSISSDEENQFIREFVGDRNLPVWIGLYRTTNELCAGSDCKNWMWLDGSEVGYSQWSVAFGTSGQCVLMAAQGLWGHYSSCSTPYGYVCEKNRITPTTTSESTMITSTSFTNSEHTTITRMRKMSTFPDPVAVMASPVANDDSRTYIGVGVSVAILIISVSIGLGVYFMKTRRGEKRETQTSSGTSNVWGATIGTEEYENCSPDASCGQHFTYAHDVQLNTLSGLKEEANASNDSQHADNPAYEEVKHYSEVSPEYTCLQVANSADT